jgi:hypothetical protein
MLQVIALESMLQLGAIKSGLASPRRIAQGRSLEIETRQQLPMQVDGKVAFFMRFCYYHNSLYVLSCYRGTLRATAL